MIFFKFPITWQTSFDYFLYSNLEPERPALLYKKWLLSGRKFRPKLNFTQKRMSVQTELWPNTEFWPQCMTDTRVDEVLIFLGIFFLPQLGLSNSKANLHQISWNFEKMFKSMVENNVFLEKISIEFLFLFWKTIMFSHINLRTLRKILKQGLDQPDFLEHAPNKLFIFGYFSPYWKVPYIKISGMCHNVPRF